MQTNRFSNLFVIIRSKSSQISWRGRDIIPDVYWCNWQSTGFQRAFHFFYAFWFYICFYSNTYTALSLCLLTVRICRVVVENTACSPVKATHDHKVTLVVWFSAETLLTHRQEAAVFDRWGAQFTRQDDSVDQHYGNVALLQMRLDFLNGYRTIERERSKFHK